MKSFTARKVLELVNTHVPRFSPNETVSSLIGVLRELESYEAIVEYDSRVDLVTLDNLLSVVNPNSTSIKNVSSSSIPIPSEASLLTAADIMATNRVWALIVKLGKEVLGTVSQKDIVKVMPAYSILSNTSCGELVGEPAKTLNINDKISTARKVMQKSRVSCLIVVDDDDRLRGVITARELVLNLLQPGESRTRGERGGEAIRLWNLPVRSIMDENPLVFSSDDPASRALNGFKRSNKLACVIVDNSRPIGLITHMELISMLLKFKVKEEPRTYIIGLPDLEGESELEVVQSKLLRVMKRGFGIHRGISEVVIDVKRMKRSGGRRLYKITARVYMPNKLLTISAEGWDLMESFDKLCRRLDRRFSREKAKVYPSKRI